MAISGMILPALLVFVYGLLFGSFLNVCIYRIPLGKSIVNPPSSCPNCGKFIKWYDNLPLISYILLRGKCRFCGEKISGRYPLVEFLTGLLFVLFFVKFGLVKIYFSYIILIGFMIMLVFIDIDRKIVPDGIIVFLILTGVIFNVFGLRNLNVFEGIIGAVTGGIIIYFINFFSNGKIGEGDIKLMTALGMCCGAYDILRIIFYSFIIGAAFSVVMLALKKYKKNDEIAFVPFIGAAFLLNGLLTQIK
jgi:leader peptidase (prepilin peptidase)/N-methyltransferase